MGSSVQSIFLKSDMFTFFHTYVRAEIISKVMKFIAVYRRVFFAELVVANLVNNCTILWNPRLTVPSPHKSSPLGHMPVQFNSFHILTFSFFVINFTCSTPRQIFLIGSFLSVMPARILFAFYMLGSVHRESNLITVQEDATYSVYYISVGSSTCFGC